MRTVISGGAGFIGSHLVRRLLKTDNHDEIVVYDNFSSGTRWHLEEIAHETRLIIIEGDIADTSMLTASLEDADLLIHLASNADIAAAANDPTVDFWTGTFLAQQVLEAARVNGVKSVLYTSGSGVYGDQGLTEVDETFGPLFPISTYGASKLAGESLICSYCHMFDMRAAAFRFANVVGPRQTHGIVYDLVRKLVADPHHLAVLGDGSQSKSYIHVDDVIDAMMLMQRALPERFDVFNVGTDEYVTVREIVEMVTDEMQIDNVDVQYGLEPRGWKGDVPVVRFSSHKIRQRGWKNEHSTKNALGESIRAIAAEVRAELLT